MKKKQIAYILMGLLVVGAAWYFFSKSKTNALTDTSSDPSDPFTIDDTNAYNQLRALIPKGDWGWMDDLAAKRYNNEPGYIGKRLSKAQTYQLVISSSAPHPNGKYPATAWSNGQPVLWPHDTYIKMWEIINGLSAKYNTL